MISAYCKLTSYVWPNLNNSALGVCAFISGAWRAVSQRPPIATPALRFQWECVLYKCICIFEVQADERALVQLTEAGHIVGDHAAFFFGAGRAAFAC
jgi:hypothetical protein